MKLYKQENEYGTDIIIKDTNKSLAFRFGGNGDLYWVVNSNEEYIDDKIDFLITKENYKLYWLFEQLFMDIKTCSIFDGVNMMPFYIKNSEYNNNYLIEQRETLKHALNYMKQKELYNEKENIVTWYSDETSHKVGNILKIKKEEDKFKLEFFIQKYFGDYDKDFNYFGYIPIRFRNSGCYYAPFNIIFMRMFHNMALLDDINEEGHQIHIEEYLYENVNCLKMISKV